MIPNASSASSPFHGQPAVLHGQPAAAIAGRPTVQSRPERTVHALEQPDDGDILSHDDVAALDSLFYQLQQLGDADPGKLADIASLFLSLKAHARLIDYALQHAAGTPQLLRLTSALVVFLRRFNHALCHQSALLEVMDVPTIRSLCHGLSACASPHAGVMFSKSQAGKVRPALQGITDALLGRLAALGMPDAANANGEVLDILNWVSRGLKSDLLKPGAAIRKAYSQALELFASWLGSDHSRGFLSLHQLAKCAVQVDLMAKNKLVALEGGMAEGGANRARLAQCALGLCSGAVLDRIDCGPSGSGARPANEVALINLCNVLKTLLEKRVLRIDDSALAAPLARLLGLIVRIPADGLCSGNCQILSNCSNFVRTLFELGDYAQPGLKPYLPLLETACAHLIATVNGPDYAQGQPNSQAIANLISFVKLCDKRLQRADDHGSALVTGQLVQAAGILQESLIARAAAGFRSAEAVGGLLSGLCYLWRRGLAASSGKTRQWMEALMHAAAGIEAACWSDKSRASALPAMQALIELDLITLAAAQPALQVLLTGPASASNGYTLADLAQAVKALGPIEEPVVALPPLRPEQLAPQPAPAAASATPEDPLRAIPGLTRLIPQYLTTASSLTSSTVKTDRGAPAPRLASRPAPPVWRAPAKVARSLPQQQPSPPAPQPELAAPASRLASLPSSSTATASSTTTIAAAAPAKPAKPAGRKPKAASAKGKALKPEQQWFSLLKNGSPGDLAHLQRLLSSHPGLVNQKDGAGRNGLAYAIAGGSASLVEWLMARKDYAAPECIEEFLHGLWPDNMLYSPAFGAALRCFLAAQSEAVKDGLRRHFADNPPPMQGIVAILTECGLHAGPLAATTGAMTGAVSRPLEPENAGHVEQPVYALYAKAGKSKDLRAETLPDTTPRQSVAVAVDENWVRRTVMNGSAEDQCNLAVMYERGMGMPKNAVMAATWYRKAAERGFAEAQFNFGVMLLDGRGVARDDKAAFRWTHEAAKQNHARAQYNLGAMLMDGAGCDKDEQAAIEWLRLASKHGHAQAQDALKQWSGPSPDGNEND